MESNNLFNMALNEETDVNTLVEYYRERILNFDKERTEWLERL